MRPPGASRALMPGQSILFAICTSASLGLSSCQQYERKPLDLAAQRDAQHHRVIESESLARFVDRLRATGTPVPGAFSFDDGLTWAEGEFVALFYNADLRAARLEAGVALADYEHAELWEDPEFGFDGAELLSPSGPFQYGLRVSLTIPISGRLAVEKSRAGAAYAAELRRIVDVEWSTRARVRQAWAAWTAAERRVDLLRKGAAQVERIKSITASLAAAGELSRVEGRLFRVELAQRQADVVQMQQQARETKIDLLGLMGLPPDAAIELLPEFPAVDPPLIDEVTARLIESNTELAIRRADYHVAEESLRLEVREQYPDVTIGSGYGSEDNDDRLLLGASIPIPIVNANRGGIAQARAKREVARAAAESTLERLAREYASTASALESATMQREHFESDIVPLLDEQAVDVERIADLGDVNTLLLLDTVTRQVEAKIRLIDLRHAEINAAVELRAMLGPDTQHEPAPIADPQAHDMGGES